MISVVSSRDIDDCIRNSYDATISSFPEFAMLDDVIIPMLLHYPHFLSTDPQAGSTHIQFYHPPIIGTIHNISISTGPSDNQYYLQLWGQSKSSAQYRSSTPPFYRGFVLIDELHRYLTNIITTDFQYD